MCADRGHSVQGWSAMAGSSRRDIVREGEIGVYHTWSRCVQRAFLCGYDDVTQTDFDHRREWIKKLLEFQASIFACDIGNPIFLNRPARHAPGRPDSAHARSAHLRALFLYSAPENPNLGQISSPTLAHPY